MVPQNPAIFISRGEILMLFNVYDWEKSSKVSIHVNELIARISAFNIRDGSHEETAKCFAVMARTELARKLKIYGGSGCEKHKECEICSEPGHCLEYGIPVMDIPQIIREAILETDNKIITFEGKPIRPYFHYRCGGSTENSENVIGNKITYLRKVFCDYCKGVEDEGKDKFFTLEELERLLDIRIEKPRDEYYNINGIFEDINIDEEGRIKTIKIGGKIFKGTDLMNILNLNSTRFNYMPVRFLISCIGKGHGLGLCLTGAEKMAEMGMKYEEILDYYYTGIKLEKMQVPEKEKPLKGQVIVLDAASGKGDSNEAKGPSDLKEGEVNLSIVRQLEKLLLEDGAKVFLTRQNEDHLILSKRVELANERKPNFFISIGQNTFPNETASGTEIYHYREDETGKNLSNFIMEEVSTALMSRRRGVRVAEFYLLREVRCSAIFIQLLYITNPEDDKKLADFDMQRKAAAAIYQAIRKYYGR